MVTERVSEAPLAVTTRIDPTAADADALTSSMVAYPLEPWAPVPPEQNHALDSSVTAGTDATGAPVNGLPAALPARWSPTPTPTSAATRMITKTNRLRS